MNNKNKHFTYLISTIICICTLFTLAGCDNSATSFREISSTGNNSGEAKEANKSSSNEKKVAKVLKTYTYGEQITKPDIVVGDRYFDTQIADYSTNFELYEGKSIEIEGFYIDSKPYMFVGRYSTSNLCPTCPQGYSYFEFEWHGDEELSFTDEKEWLKIRGVLKRGEDETGEYYYIEARNIQVMSEWGVDTVSN